MRLLEPFRIRNFSLVWLGLAVSLLGDGIYFIAIAWQVYALSNTPSALSLVGLAWLLPHLGALVIGGAASDRFSRRWVIILSSLAAGSAIGVLAGLSLAHALELWHIFPIVAVYGCATAFFIPAAQAIIPEVVPRELLQQAAAVRQFVRPLALRLVGPALGGVLIGTIGVGGALAVDAVTFLVPIATLALVRLPRLEHPPEAAHGTDAGPLGGFLGDIAVGVRFVLGERWLGVTMLGCSVSLLLTVGPIEVLIPYLVKNELDLGANGLGFVFAAGGAGAIVSALVMGQRDFPRRYLSQLYLSWGLGALGLTLLAFAGGLGGAMAALFCLFALMTVGDVLWATLLQKRVPGHLLGRVSSLDWLVSIAFVPLSFALTGPVAALLGAKETLAAAGLLGALAWICFLSLPVLRQDERAGFDDAVPATAS
jgi:MFS family permease